MKKYPVVHFEMPAEDMKRMTEFYATTFGWEADEMGLEMGSYAVVKTAEIGENGFPKEAGRINGGFFPKGAGGGATTPMLVVAVDDINEHMKKVAAAGGTIINGPVDIPHVGLYTSFTDTEGNRMAMLQPSR